MSLCVIDASFVFQWVFDDEATPEGDAALAVILAGGAVIPLLWPFEVTNALGIAERRGRLTLAETVGALKLLRQLPLQLDDQPTMAQAERVLHLMQRYRLTGYDAAYLELAYRLQLPLATKDAELVVAASMAGVILFDTGPKVR